MIAPPTDEADAQQKFDRPTDHVDTLQSGGSAAAVGRIGGLLSWFWWIQEPERWPMQFSSGTKLLDTLGFLVAPVEGPWPRYADYRRHVHRFDPFPEVELVLYAAADSSRLGMDPTATERCPASLSPPSPLPLRSCGSNLRPTVPRDVISRLPLLNLRHADNLGRRTVCRSPRRQNSAIAQERVVQRYSTGRLSGGLNRPPVFRAPSPLSRSYRGATCRQPGVRTGER